MRIRSRKAPTYLSRAVLLWLLAATIPAAAQVGSGRDSGRTERVAAFVVGNIEYILLHELAHLVIRDLDVPVIGSEESAADYIAAMALIDAARFDPTTAARAREYLAATANGLVSTWEIYERSGETARYWDGHGLTIQRFYNAVCLLYGSDQSTFAQLPSRIGLPSNRANRCPDEYARAGLALSWLLTNYGRPAGIPVEPQYRLTINSPPTQSSAAVIRAMEATDMLQNTLRLFNEQFLLPAEFQISFRRCGQFQAGWNAGARELVFCYELIDYYYSLGMTRAANDRRSILEP